MRWLGLLLVLVFPLRLAGQELFGNFSAAPDSFPQEWIHTHRIQTIDVYETTDEQASSAPSSTFKVEKPFTTYEFDRAGRLLHFQGNEFLGHPLPLEIRFGYNEQGLKEEMLIQIDLSQAADPPADPIATHTTHYRYNEKGQLVEFTEYDSLMILFGPEQEVHGVDWDAAGRLLREYILLSDGDTMALWGWEYERQWVRMYDYGFGNERGEVEAAWRTNKRGQVVELIHQSYSSDPQLQSLYFYDADRLMREEINFKSEDGTKFAPFYTKTYHYGAAGRMEKIELRSQTGIRTFELQYTFYQ